MEWWINDTNSFCKLESYFAHTWENFMPPLLLLNVCLIWRLWNCAAASDQPSCLRAWLVDTANAPRCLLPSITDLIASAHGLEIQDNGFPSSLLQILGNSFSCHLLNTVWWFSIIWSSHLQRNIERRLLNQPIVILVDTLWIVEKKIIYKKQSIICPLKRE